jgi:Rps23 Pro-64 3,4-dihydroxylase Tpa1-like proline 4-hydroxylase
MQSPAFPEHSNAALPPHMADGLAEHGWSQHNVFLSPELTLELAAECRVLADSGALNPAGIGKGAAQLLRADIRGDRILWLQAGQSPACDRYLQIMENLRMTLNRELYLGWTNMKAISRFTRRAPATRPTWTVFATTTAAPYRWSFTLTRTGCRNKAAPCACIR